MNTLRIALAQTTHPKDGDAAGLVARVCEQAAQERCELVVFPESLMTPYEKDKGAFLKEAEPIDGPFSQSVCATAKRLGLWAAYTVNELNPNGHPFNTAVIADSAGEICGSYRKTHLFDTDFTKESDRMAQGDALFTPIDSPWGKIGLGICYDLRFPEVARKQALEGATLLLYPAAWVAGDLKIEQWETLIRARALENELFVAGVSRADEGYIGHSCIADPRGTIAARAGAGDELLIADLDFSLIDCVRSAMPVFDHRRPSLY